MSDTPNLEELHQQLLQEAGHISPTGDNSDFLGKVKKALDMVFNLELPVNWTPTSPKEFKGDERVMVYYNTFTKELTCIHNKMNEYGVKLGDDYYTSTDYGQTWKAAKPILGQ